MKDEDGLPTTTASAKKETMDSGLFGKGRYKFWALAAILLLAFWSMFTGTVSLRWSGNGGEGESGEAHVGRVHQQP
ncbi:hypothetical protein SESBI_18259 [Sesbania bispinosa]|nr:hypothetical protein SESBI_18259 [Sesbania bispinosa]